jgi:glutamate decarboxylase
MEGPFRKESAAEARKVNRLINGLNIKLHKALRRDDTTFVSRTVLESTPYRPQNIVVLRAVLVNPLTTRKTLGKIVSTQHRIGCQLWKDFAPVYRKMLPG